MRAPRVFARLRRRAAWVLDRRVQVLYDRMDALGGQLIELEKELRAVRADVGAVRADVGALRDQVPPVLRAIVSEEPANRRRLDQLRTEPAYALPFEDPDPLVTVCVPTYDRVRLLTERALPSVLAQTHARLEVLVVGDASP